MSSKATADDVVAYHHRRGARVRVTVKLVIGRGVSRNNENRVGRLTHAFVAAIKRRGGGEIISSAETVFHTGASGVAGGGQKCTTGW